MNTTIRDNFTPSPPALPPSSAVSPTVRPFIVHRSPFIVRHSAFTLIELMVVIAIIAILFTIALPAAKALSKGNDQAQARNLIRSYLVSARSIAISQHRQAGVVFFQETILHARPAHTDQTALQLFVEDYDQTTTTPHNPKNTLFIQYSTAREYLPPSIAVAALNDASNKGVINGDSGGGHNLAILFSPTGEMTTRHGIACRNINAVSRTPGKYPWALGDWNFASQGTTNSDNSSDGISSPGIFLYDRNEYTAKDLANGADADRNTWIKSHADVLLVNANTGNITQ